MDCPDNLLDILSKLQELKTIETLRGDMQLTYEEVELLARLIEKVEEICK